MHCTDAQRGVGPPSVALRLRQLYSMSEPRSSHTNDAARSCGRALLDGDGRATGPNAAVQGVVPGAPLPAPASRPLAVCRSVCYALVGLSLGGRRCASQKTRWNVHNPFCGNCLGSKFFFFLCRSYAGRAEGVGLDKIAGEWHG